MSKPKTVTTKIKEIRVSGPWGEYGEVERYQIGTDVTEIKETQREGQMSYIPYVEVWKGDKKFAEFCMHNIVGVYYE